MKRIVYHIGRGLLAVLVLLLAVNACKKEKIEKPEAILQIDSYYPNSGKEGTLVTIKGQGFNPKQSTVSFAGMTAELVSATSDMIVVQAPVGEHSGKISLSTGGNNLEIGDYTYQNLSVQGISPGNGPAGTNIRISGEGFSSVNGPAKVSINNIEAIVVSANDTLLVAKVPIDAGSGPVTVAVDGKESSGQPFTFQAIRGIKPLTGGKGTKVTITGEGFEETANNNVVDFNGKLAKVLEATGNQLVVEAPENVSTGPLSVTINGQKTVGPLFSMVPPPTINLVTPLSGPAGSEMTISGTQFSSIPDENTVIINGTEIPVTTASSNQLKLILPGGTGNGKVKVNVNDQVAEGPDFVDQNLGILAVSPENGLAGTEITITGVGFSANPAENTVTFNGTQAMITSATPTRLIVTAPDGLTSGILKVNVGTLEAQAAKPFSRAGMVTLAGSPGDPQLSGIQFMGVDSRKNVYVASRYQVFKISQDGTIISLAGSSSGGVNVDGTGSGASFSYIGGLVIDNQDNVFVSSGGLRKVTQDGVVTTVTTALPDGLLAMDPNGNFYRTAYFAGIMKYDKLGDVTSLFSGQINYQSRPAIDSQGIIYYSYDMYQPTIYRYVPGENTVVGTRFLGGGTGQIDGLFSQATFSTGISGLVFDADENLLILDKGNNAIRKADFSTQEVSTLMKVNQQGGTGFVDGDFTKAQWSFNILDIAIDQDGDLYVIDGANNAVRKIFLR